MPKIKMVVAYDGTHYLGWQKTSMGPSIEAAVEEALERFLRQKVELQGSSRTDAGVHAREQIVQFNLKTAVQGDKVMQDFESESLSTGADHSQKVKAAHIESDYGSKDCVNLSSSTAFFRFNVDNDDINFFRLEKSLNSMLPRDIAVWNIEVVPEFVKPQSKEYRYYVCNGPVQFPQNRLYSWHFIYPLDLSLMQKAAKEIVGTHDFSAFCNVKKGETYEDYVRTIMNLEITPIPNNRFVFSITGDNFLYKMVRNIVGTLCYIGSGKIQPDELPNILQSKDRTLAGITAPAHGLVLHRTALEQILKNS